ncbi:protein kinase [Myxococcota bacterium]|nr:protein kinase [Myxococcota bacterium]MBU1900410.1 protein kinase [Myxococcota bacterium]
MSAPRKKGELISERYRIESVLGEGGMAWVYAAQDEYLNRRVAFKELRPQMASMSARFEREARVAGALQHPAVVKVFGYGQSDQGAYIVFEFVEGETLAALLQRTGPLPMQRVARLLRPVLGALAEAHEAGVIHRDLKPENLIMQRGAGLEEHVRLLDFGIAALSDASERLTREGEVFGTPHFMSPQQIKGEEVTAAADVWAVGVIMYNMITGVLPFNGPHAASILFKVVNEPLPPLPEGLDSRFAALLSRCLDKDPHERFADARALLHEIEALLPPPPEGTLCLSAPQLKAARRAEGATTPMARVEVFKTQILALRGIEPRWLLPSLAGLSACLGLTLGLLLSDAPPSDAPPSEAPPSEAPSSDTKTQHTKPPKAPQKPPKAAPSGPLAEAEGALNEGDVARAKAWLTIHPSAGTLATRARLEGLIAHREGEYEAAMTRLSEALEADPKLKADPEIIEVAFVALQDYKGKAAEGLLGGALFSPEVEARLQALSGDSRNHVRWRAVGAIEAGGGDLKRAQILAYTLNLKADDCDLRRRAAYKLGELGDPSVIPAIQQMIRNTGPFDRFCMDDAGQIAVRKLKKIEEAAAKPAKAP